MSQAKENIAKRRRIAVNTSLDNFRGQLNLFFNSPSDKITNDQINSAFSQADSDCNNSDNCSDNHNTYYSQCKGNLDLLRKLGFKGHHIKKIVKSQNPHFSDSVDETPQCLNIIANFIKFAPYIVLLVEDKSQIAYYQDGLAVNGLGIFTADNLSDILCGSNDIPHTLENIVVNNLDAVLQVITAKDTGITNPVNKKTIKGLGLLNAQQFSLLFDQAGQYITEQNSSFLADTLDKIISFITPAGEMTKSISNPIPIIGMGATLSAEDLCQIILNNRKNGVGTSDSFSRITNILVKITGTGCKQIPSIVKEFATAVNYEHRLSQLDQDPLTTLDESMVNSTACAAQI